MRILVSILLLGMAVWLLPASWLERAASQEAGKVTEEGAGQFADFAEVQARFAYQALLEGRLDDAGAFLRQAIATDVAAMDAWLRLAEAEAGKGRTAQAQKLLGLVADLTPGVLRWKWSQAVLARDLGMADVSTASLNSLVAAGRHVNDAFYLLEIDQRQHTPAVLEKLLPENREPYLRWLMQWRRPEDASLVWNALPLNRQEDPTLRLSFIDFLINNNKMLLVQDLWQTVADPSGITNPGFEGTLTQRGFDWRFSNRKGEWIIQQTGYPFHSGRQSLEIHFSGQANSNFSSLYQYVPVSTGKRYRLAYWWKAKQITTDQGPFVEVTGKDCKGLYQKGPMIVDTEDWAQVALEFDVPKGCDTALVRLRRLPSRRFDNKIEGTVWLDDFSLRPVVNE